MKLRVLLVLGGLATSFTGAAFAQQKDTITDPQIVEQLHAIGMKSDEAFKKGDAAARAALFAEDAILVTYTGPIYGREAIEKYYADFFQKVHFIDQLTTYDPNSPHPIGTDGKTVMENGEWKATIQGQTGGPTQLKGNWASVKVREGDDWKIRLTITNVTPAPALAQKKGTEADSQLAQQLEAIGKTSDEGFNKGDVASIAAVFTQDAVLLLEDGPVYGKPAIEKWLESVFQNVRFSNHLTEADQKAPPILSKAGNEAWWFGKWSTAVQGKNGPAQQAKGYWSAVHVREGDAWKTCMLTIIQTPQPPATGAATPSPTTTPSSQ